MMNTFPDVSWRLVFIFISRAEAGSTIGNQQLISEDNVILGGLFRIGTMADLDMIRETITTATYSAR